jgi:acetylornithine deacetylase
VIEALRGLEAELNAVRPPRFAAYAHPLNLNVGMIRGGDWPSTVAGECVTHCRLALYPGERVADLKERVEQTVAEAVASRPALSGYRADVLYDGFQCEGYELEHDAPLVSGLADACARVTGQRPPLFASTATTDARTFQLYGGTPAVCFGPVAENKHGVDERVHLPSVTRTAQAIALFIATGAGSPVRRTKTRLRILRIDSCPRGGPAPSLLP